MTKNPLLNALAAALYIVGIVSILSYAGTLKGPDTPDSFIIPMVMLSLLVLSVLTMAYCFFFNPIQMYLDGQRKEAAALFSANIAWFAGMVAALLVVEFFLPV